MHNPASPLEIAWTLIALIAIGFTVWILVDNAQNFNAVRAAVRQGRAVHRGPRWWVAIASLVSSMAMLVVWIGFAVVGGLAMTAGPNSDVVYRIWVSSVTGWVLILTTLLLASVQAWQVFARTKIRPIIQPPDVHSASEPHR